VGRSLREVRDVAFTPPAPSRSKTTGAVGLTVDTDPRALVMFSRPVKAQSAVFPKQTIKFG
jgi:hypothetical protein